MFCLSENIVMLLTFINYYNLVYHKFFCEMLKWTIYKKLIILDLYRPN